MGSIPRVQGTDEVYRRMRCAVYTRKSTEEGLGQNFNSLDAQREAAAAYIASQRQQGWSMVATRYDDGGFTGANTDRPALQRLVADIRNRAVDCVVVYKVDRLSRSLLDFARLMHIFEEHGVSFVSVTQQFNTTASLGRLTLNILLSFAQFEREIIGERTRDKMSAARARGKWVGGTPVLGYDVHPDGGRLVVHEAEAVVVRQVFSLYLKHGAILPVVEQLARLGCTTKRWTSRRGKLHGGSPLTRAGVRAVLANIVYSGRILHRGNIYPGEHPAIVEPEVWDRANALLRNAPESELPVRRSGSRALLRGLVHCEACGRLMTPGYTAKRGRRYEYYVCGVAREKGYGACASGALAARTLEAAVIAELQTLAAPGFSSCWEASSSGDKRQLMLRTVRRVSIASGGKASIRLAGECRHILDAFTSGSECTTDAASVPSDSITAEFILPPSKRSACAADDSPPIGRLPRITRLLALAIRFEKLLAEGTARHYADLGRLGHVSRSRITQVMGLLNLPPDIQEQILFFPPVHNGPDPVVEHEIRRVLRPADWSAQRALWAGVLACKSIRQSKKAGPAKARQRN